ncbi:MAG: GNAT family N-acetyltransferase [Xanthomonadaceae bacterium]|nr:GNAT family N-acetyltransferase [Xanthomonadaceae bacterium]MDP2187028.1 GNAT family N-acetyltransferase [Xanthomonadales bacterium]MDZ4115447.1 GNAT family N-acetyltransferase [Xanthomonadaceae bacterium]MDZ4378491.1 GNAT family N-acetyltransferase [Xanthomonadaceae bacterium]
MKPQCCDIALRPAHAEDLPALLALEAQFPGDRMTARQFRRHLHSASARFQVAQQGVAVIGASLLFFRSGSDSARLYSLIVAASARAQGIGARLLADAEQAARDRDCQWLRLEVRTDNTAAIALYQRAGYRVVGQRPGYYDDGAAALRMQRAL